MTQHEQLLNLFREHGNRVTLGQILQTTLAAEYRARMTELRRKGYGIICELHSPKSGNVYRLIEPAVYQEEPSGQLLCL